MKIPVCKHCYRKGHYKTFCPIRPQKPIVNRVRRPRPDGKEYYKWQKFRTEIAIPYLDKTYGRKCSCCGSADNLSIDHIINKGSRSDLKYDLNNLQYLCFDCHRAKTDNKTCSHSIVLDP